MSRKLERNEGSTILCAVKEDGGKLCMDGKMSDDAAQKAAFASFTEDKEVLRGFCGVFTLGPPLFVFLILMVIARSGGIPAGLRSVEVKESEP